MDSIKSECNKKNYNDSFFDAVFPTREQFLESCLPQAFSLPMPIMKYIWENPSSPEVYQKLIKCCKLFFLKNPILVLYGLDYHYSYGWKYCNSNECDGDKHFYGHGHKKINMDKYEGKIWVMRNFHADADIESTVACDLIPKMYRNDIYNLKLHNQILSYDELKFLASGVKVCNFEHNAIKYDNGEEVPLDEVIKLFSGAKYVTLPLKILSSRYVEFFNACCRIENVILFNDLDNFDIREFYQQMKRCNNHAVFIIHLLQINNNHLDDFTDEILSTVSFDFVPPVFKCFRQDEAKLKKMVEIQEREAAKYR